MVAYVASERKQVEKIIHKNTTKTKYNYYTYKTIITMHYSPKKR